MAIEQRNNKNGAKSFRARVKDPAGKFYRSEWKPNKDEAMTEEATQASRKRRGELVSAEAEGTRYTYDDLWAVFSVENRAEVSDGWKISQDQMNRDYVSPVIGEKLIAKIGRPDIGRVLTRMKEMGRGEQMRKHVYTLMNQVFDFAVHYYKLIKESPVSAEYHRMKVPEVESMFLRPEQSWALLELARDDNPAVWVELLAGLRTEATVALTWPNVQWDASQLLICQAWKSKVRRMEPFPKGKKAEYVPMPSVLKEYLWERFQKCSDPDGFVCPGPRGGMLSPSTFLPRLKKLCKKAGVPEVSPHKLRHSCTELFVREGASQEDIRRLLNHKRGTTTLRYMHRTDDRLNAIAARIQRPSLRLITEGGNGITHEITQEGNFGRTSLEEVSGKCI